MHAPATPKPIDQRLMVAGRCRSKQLAKQFGLRMVKWVAIGALVLALLDLVFQLGSLPRLVLGITWAVGLVGLIGYGIWWAFARKSDLSSTARFLESREPKLGSKLINILQLREQTNADSELPNRDDLTQMLAERAVADAEAGVADIEFKPLTGLTNVRREWKLAAIPIAVLLLLGACFWTATKTELLRYFDPFGNHPPFSFTQLTITQPNEQIAEVTYGESIVIEAGFSGHRPDEVTLIAVDPLDPKGVEQKLPMYSRGEKAFVQEIQNVRTNLHYSVRAGRSRSAIGEIKVILTPQFESAAVRVKPPAYTKLPAVDKGYAYKGLRALEGSEITFTIGSNRPLADGSIGFEGAGILEEGAEDTPATTALTPLAEPSANKASATLVAHRSGALQFAIEDITGLVAEGEAKGTLTVTHDLPPTIQLTKPEADAFIVSTHKTEITIEADDDYGLAEVRLQRGYNGEWEAPLVYKYNKDESPDRHASTSYKLDLEMQGARSGDVLSFFAEAVDIRPEAQVTRSRTIKLYVISEEEYNDMLRQQRDITDAKKKYDALMADLQDLLDQQEQLRQDAADTQEQLESGDISAEEAAEKMAALAEAQSQVNEGLKDLAQRMDETVRDNPLYDIEKTAGDSLRELADAIRDSTEQNQQVADQAKEAAGQEQASASEEQNSESSESNSESQSEQSEQSGEQGDPQTAENDSQEPGEQSESGEQSGEDQQQQASSSQGQPQSGSQGGSPPSAEQLAQAAEAMQQAAEEQLEKLGRQQQQAQAAQQPMQDAALVQEIQKDFNTFKALYEAQNKITEQTGAYAAQGELTPTDRAALKGLAGQEKAIEETLKALTEKLKLDAENAAEKFPKASESAQKLADAIEQVRIPQGAARAAQRMLQGQGEGSHLGAEWVSTAMEDLFEECESCNSSGSGMQQELDRYMQLTHGAEAGQTFEQMAQCQKNGMGQGQGQGQGNGGQGFGGMAESSGAGQMGVLGAESLGGEGGGDRSDMGEGKADPSKLTSRSQAEGDQGDPGDREVEASPAEAVSSETLIEQYRSLTDAYFEKLTTDRDENVEPVSRPALPVGTQ